MPTPCLRVVAALLLAGCTGSGLVEPAEIRPPIRVSIAERAAPIRFARLVLGVPRGSTIGVHLPGWFCYGPYDPVVLGASRDLIQDPEVIAVFEQEMSAAGYDVVGANRMFALDDEMARTRFQIGARITRLGMDLCQHRNLLYLLSDAGVSGEASMTVEWEVYAPLERRVVYATATSGHAELDEPSQTGAMVLAQRAFAAAVANLAADRGFHDLIFAAGAPSRIFGGSEAAAAWTGGGAAAGGGGAAEPITIVPAVPSGGPIAERIEAVRAASVLIRVPDGHGSGVFVGSDGYILTNAHVVGAAGQVAVRLLSGRELTGEVVRRDRLRDVALVRVPGTGFPALPVRATPVGVGEEVYAVGAPLDRRLQDTVTRGIVSAVRLHPDSGLPVIQSDVTIQHGNSGGPLVDARGTLVAIAVSGHMDAADRTVGLNFFVPIADALDRLDLRMGSAAAAR